MSGKFFLSCFQIVSDCVSYLCSEMFSINKTEMCSDSVSDYFLYLFMLFNVFQIVSEKNMCQATNTKHMLFHIFSMCYRFPFTAKSGFIQFFFLLFLELDIAAVY